MIRVISFLLLATVGFVGPWWLFAIGLTLYAYRYAGFEILAITFLVDALFMGINGIIPYYTLGTVVVMILLELVRPYLTLYSD